MERQDNFTLVVPAIDEMVAKVSQRIDKLLPILDTVGDD